MRSSLRYMLLGFTADPVPDPTPSPSGTPLQGADDFPHPLPDTAGGGASSELAALTPPLFGALAAGVCFFLSGFSALVFEVIWMRRLHLVLGSTGFAIATVVAAYMGGLALGSFVFGRFAERFKRPFLVYGILELGVGLYAVFVPSIFDASVPIYRWLWESFHFSFYPFSILRFFLALLILVIPTTFMGATLPVMSRYLVRSKGRIGSSVGLLYAINTFGAVAGSAVSGFVLLPNLGEWKSLVYAALGNALIALIVVTYSLLKKDDVVPAATPAEAEPSVPQAPPVAIPLDLKLSRAAILTAFAGSGIASMAMQIAWTRLLSLLLGSSVYAFSVILTTFLAGLAIGSFIASRLAGYVKRPLLWLSLFQGAAGLMALVGVFWFNYLFYLFVQLFNRQELNKSFGALFMANFFMAAIIIFPPTLFMGAAFPMGVKAYAQNLVKLGRSVGEVYSINTLGAIFGSFLGGFVLLPLLGVQLTVETGVVVYFLTASCLALTFRHAGLSLKLGLAVPMLVAIPLALFVTPKADPHIMSAGVYKYASYYSDVDSYADFRRRMAPDRRRMVFYKEGITTTVNVMKFQSQYSVAVNGKIDGSSVGDMHTQLLSGHLPMLFAEDPKKALVVGYGTGVTVGSIALHEGVTVDCIELEGAVIEAGWFFRHVNKDTAKLIEEGKVRIIKNDGRNILLATRDKWDVIVSEPSNPWISGASKLFTYEFFEMAKGRLNDGGIFGQWVQLYGMDDVNVRSLIMTFREAFGQIVIFMPSPGADLLMIGRKGGDLKVRRERLESFFTDKAVADDLALVGIDSPEAVAAYFLAGDEQAASFVVSGEKIPPLNTDDNSFIEFNAPRTFFVRGRAYSIQEAIERRYAGPFPVFEGWEGKEAALFLARTGEEMLELREPLAHELAARSLAIARTADGLALKARLGWSDSIKKTREALDEALALDPVNRNCLLKRAHFAWERDHHFRELLYLRRAREVCGDLEVKYRFALACDNVANLLGEALGPVGGLPAGPGAEPSTFLAAFRMLLYRAAASDFMGLEGDERALRAAPQLHHKLGNISARFGDLEGAARHLKIHLEGTPSSPSCRRDLIEVLLKLGRTAEAKGFEGPKNMPETGRRLWENAKSLFATGSTKNALEAIFMAVEAAPYDWKLALDAGMLLRNIGRLSEACDVWHRALRYFPGHLEIAPSYAFIQEILADGAEDPGRRETMYREAAKALTDAARREANPAQANEYRHRAEELLQCAERATERITVADLIRR